MGLTEVVFAACAPGLEPALEREARLLGQPRCVAGGVEIEGGEGLVRRANLWLRTAGRVSLRLTELPLGTPKALADAVAAIDLRPYRRPGEPLELEILSRAPGFPERRLRPLLERALAPLAPADGRGTGPSLRLRISQGRFELGLDTSGEPLSRRGYRLEGSRAPLRETLAAGLLRLAGYDGGEPFWDPFCGSGTLAIEAAAMARRRAPGVASGFAFERWPCHDRVAWARELEVARAGERSAGAPPVGGSDLNAGALGTARRNARRAGVEVDWFRHDATAHWPGRPAAGLLASNLPFGKRVGERGELPRLYRAFGRALADLPGWRVAVLVPEGELGRELRWTAEESHRLSNGGLPCLLLVGRANH